MVAPDFFGLILMAVVGEYGIGDLYVFRRFIVIKDNVCAINIVDTNKTNFSGGAEGGKAENDCR